MILHQIKEEFNRRMVVESLQRIKICVSKLNDHQLWYRPNNNSNSVGNLILHLSGNINQYILSGLSEATDVRQRSKEFLPDQNIETPYLLESIDQAINKANETVQNLKQEDLLKIFAVQCFEESGLSILIHVIEHTSYHVGQISWITKSLIDAPLHYYEDLDLEKTN